MACGSCKTCVARCSNHPVSCGHAPSQRPSPMISQKLSEPPHNLPMKSEPALADLHRIPDATIVSDAQEHGADVIVMGSRGRGDLAGLVLGSTAHKVMHLADRPVLVVR